MKRLTFLLLILLLLPASALAANSKGAKICGIQGQNLIEAGDYGKAVTVLKSCVKRYPKSDWLISLYGEALYLSGKLDEGETQFRKALAIDSNNPTAKKYIEEIRNTKTLLEDQDRAELIDRAKDVFQEILILIIGVWVGTLLSALSGNLLARFRKSNFKDFLNKEQFGSACDVLEDLMMQHKKVELRIHLNSLLDYMDFEEAKRMVIYYVEDRELEDRIVYFLEKIHRRREREKNEKLKKKAKDTE